MAVFEPNAIIPAGPERMTTPHFLTLHPAALASLQRSGARVLVTGATGWLGRAALEMLTQAFPDTWAQRVQCFGSRASSIRLRTGVEVTQQPLAQMRELPVQPSVLLHFAYLTREKVADMPVADYVETNRAITQQTLDAATAIGVERVFMTSSGAVYAALDRPQDPDPSLLYGRLKLEDEQSLQAFAEQHPQVRVLIARLFNLSGPYINKLHSYALASFISQAGQGQAIEIRAQHPVIRSYTSAENLLNLAWGELLANKAPNYQIIDTIGDREVEVQELATLVKAVVNPATGIVRGPIDPARADSYVGQASDYRALMAHHGVREHPLEEQIRDTADYILMP